MSENRLRELIMLRMEQATETLHEARILLGLKRLRHSSGRSGLT